EDAVDVDRAIAPRSPRPLRRAGIIGAGTMGCGIAVSLLEAGLPVMLVDSNLNVLEAGLRRVRATLDRAASKGRLDVDGATPAKARLRGAVTLAALADADLVIEAVFEEMAVKQRVFAALGKVCRPSAVLATNTSTLDVEQIARASSRPSDVLGMHFFSP